MKVTRNALKAMTMLALTLGSLELSAKEQRVLVKIRNRAIFNSLVQTSAQGGVQKNSADSVSVNKKQLDAVFPNVRLQYENSLNNLSAMIAKVGSEADLQKLRQNPYVDYVDVEVFHPAPRPMRGVIYTPLKEGLEGAMSSHMPWGIKAVHAMEAWKAGDKGQNSRVLVLDTGIDKNHPSIRDNFEVGRNFAGEQTVDSENYADTVGHGTHVSGTIAGVMDSTGFTGVAPKAKLLMGRVCSEQGCSNIAIAQGISWGIERKVDVISMSLGGPFATPSEREAIAKAHSAGITLVAATGNEGTPQISYPAALSEVIAVGATDINGKRGAFSQYGPELAVVAPGVDVVSSVPVGTGRASKVELNLEGQMVTVESSAFTGSRAITQAMENQLVYVGLGKPEDFSQANVQGKFALIKRGETRFSEKVQNAINAGATGAIIFNNTDGLVRGGLSEDGSEMPIPVFGIDLKAGELAVRALEQGKKLTSRVAIEVTDYASFDGTSMACPHVSGVIALMKSVNKNLTPDQVKSILQRTATKVDESNARNEYGAGIVNAEAAVQASKSATAIEPEANLPELKVGSW